MDIISIGVDQGLANIGYSVIKHTLDENNIEQDIKRLESGTVTTSSLEELPKRLLKIHDMINDLALKYNSNVIGCEKLFFNPKQSGGRNKSASIMNTNMVSGIVFLVAGQNELFAKDFTPGTVKKYMAGSGRATKEEVIKAIEAFCRKEGFITETEHEADAIAIGITTGRYYINNILPLVIAINLVSTVETQDDLYIATKSVNILPNSKDKEVLLKKIEKLEIKLLREVVINSKTQEEVDIATKLVNDLPDGRNKDLLVKKLDKITKDINKPKRKRKIKEGEVKNE